MEKKPKKTKKIILLLGLYISILSLFIIGSILDVFNAKSFYIFPPTENGYLQQIFFYGMMIIIPNIAILIGFAAGLLFIRIYLWMTKRMKSIQMIGFARFDETRSFVRRRYITQVLFGTLLCMNIWIILLQTYSFEFWIKDEYKYLIYDRSSGSMMNFPMIPWYWLPLSVTTLVMAFTFIILDSGLISIKRIRGFPKFGDTERVGNLIWNVMKGYAGISVVINFTIIITSTNLGKEASLTTYPIYTAFILITLFLTMDLYRNWTRKLVFNLVKRSTTPEIINLNYQKTPITTYKEFSQKQSQKDL